MSARASRNGDQSTSTTMNGNGSTPTGSPRDDAPSRRLGRRRFARKPASLVAETGGDDGLAAVRAELMILREENARLKAERHHPPRVATLLGSAALPAAPPAPGGDASDELAQLLTDYVVMRETLLVACDELDAALGALRSRLAALPAGLPQIAPVETGTGSAELQAVLSKLGNGTGNGRGS